MHLGCGAPGARCSARSGNGLDEARWTIADCAWSTKRKQLARAVRLAQLHNELYWEVSARVAKSKAYDDPIGPACKPAQPLTGDRVSKLDTLLAARELVHTASPKFVRELVLDTDDESQLGDSERTRADDLTHVLADGLTMYAEWAHIDRQFARLFATIPGRVSWHWFDGDPEADGE